MLTEPTIEKLYKLRLGAMAVAWTTQREDPKMNDVDFDGRFGMLVDAEHLARDNKRLARAIHEAKLRIAGACIEDIDYGAKREIDRALVRQLGTCTWIGSHANVIITGATGTGKSYVACALAQQACRTGYRAVYRRMPRLIEELAQPRERPRGRSCIARVERFIALEEPQPPGLCEDLPAGVEPGGKRCGVRGEAIKNHRIVMGP